MPKWHKMKTAPKDRAIILRINHGFTHEPVAVYGCWMAPGGNESLHNWWTAGPTTGTNSYDGLPFKFESTVVTPTGWMDMPIKSKSFF